MKFEIPRGPADKPGGGEEFPATAEELERIAQNIRSLSLSDDLEGPKVLAVRTRIESVSASPEDVETLEKAFDDRLGELTLLQMEAYPHKRELKPGFGPRGFVDDQMALEAYIKIEVPWLRMFSEERRAALRHRAEQMMWRKGYVLGWRRKS